jgi:hypothetical protein
MAGFAALAYLAGALRRASAAGKVKIWQKIIKRIAKIIISGAPQRGMAQGGKMDARGKAERISIIACDAPGWWRGLFRGWISSGSCLTHVCTHCVNVRSAASAHHAPSAFREQSAHLLAHLRVDRTAALLRCMPRLYRTLPSLAYRACLRARWVGISACAWRHRHGRRQRRQKGEKMAASGRRAHRVVTAGVSSSAGKRDGVVDRVR